MRTETFSEDAVSPVIGVMLMLVVTIIIAAVVSGFAGGLMGTSEKTPNAVIGGEFSIANGMTITHLGGDPIALGGVTFYTVPSALFGADADNFRWAINKSFLLATPHDNTSIVRAGGWYNKAALTAGESLYINATNCDTNGKDSNKVNGNSATKWDKESAKLTYFKAYQFINPDNIAKYFYLLTIDDETGTTISKTKITIAP